MLLGSILLPRFTNPIQLFWEDRRMQKKETYEIRKDDGTGEVSVHWGVEFTLPLLHLKEPLKIARKSAACMVDGKPETARVESGSKGECLFDKRRYTFSTHQVVTQEGIDIKATILEDGKTVFENAFRREQPVYDR